MILRLLVKIIFLTVLFELCITHNASAQKVSLQEIIKHIYSNRTSLPPFIGTYKHSETTTSGEGNFLNRIDEFGIKKDKIYLKYKDKDGNEYIDILDGAKRTSVFTAANNQVKKSQVSVGYNTPFGFTPLRIGLMFGNMWMDEHLSKSGLQYVGPENDPDFGLVHHVMSRENNTEFHHFLSPKYDWLNIRTEYGDVRSNNRFFFKVNKVERHANHWLPVSSVMKYGDKNTNGIPAKYQVDMTDVAYNFEPVDDSHFKVELSRGTLIGKEQKIYRVGPDNTQQLVVDKSDNKPQNHADLWGWLYMASVTTLLVLTVGAYLKWKRKQLSRSA